MFYFLYFFLMEPTEKTQFYKAMQEAVKYLCEEQNPHTKIIVDCSWYEIVQWVASETITEYIKD